MVLKGHKAINEKAPNFNKRIGKLVCKIRSTIYLIDVEEASQTFNFPRNTIKKIERGDYVPRKIKDEYLITFYDYGKEKGYRNSRGIFPQYFESYVDWCRKRRGTSMTINQYDICENYKKCMRDLRNDLGLTQAEVAEEVGYSVQTISKLENGKVPLGVAWRDILDYYLNNCTEEIIVRKWTAITEMQSKISC